MLQNTYANWRTNPSGYNQFHDIDGESYVSYLEDPDAKMKDFGMPILGSGGLSETAFFDHRKQKFYILNGDFRLEYQNAIESSDDNEERLAACTKVYQDNIDKKSVWSEDQFDEDLNV